jgi:hypothetical protein
MRLLKVFAVALCLAYVPAFATIIFVTTQAGLSPNDSFTWGQLGGDQTTIPNNFSAVSVNSLHLTGAFGTSPNDGVVADACPASPSCSWTTSGSGINAGDSLIWAFDNTANNGTGPVTFTFGSSIFGAGAWIQADTSGSYTVKLELFNGGTSLGSNTTTSDGSGDPVFFGAFDNTTADVTKAVFSLTSCAGCGGTGDLGDFVIDTLQIKGVPATVPEPASFLLFGGGLAALAWKNRKSLLNQRRGL